jgi:heptosyltransferase II
MSTQVLIRTPNHLGDCVMALPMISETREAYPGASVTVLTPEPLQELFLRNPAIDRVLTIPAKYVHGIIAMFKVKDLIAPHGFDIGYVLPPSFGAASGFKLAGVKERIGYVADGRRLLLTKPLPLPTPLNSEHRSKVYFDLLRRGSGVSLEYVKPKLFLDEDDERRGRALLSGYGVGEDAPYAVVAFQAVAESRRWGIENYTALAGQIVMESDLRVVLVGSQADAKAGEQILEGVGATHPERRERVANLAGKTTLRELAAICSRASLFVGNDSGPAHLAASVGIPLVVLSGADDPRETSPISNTKRLIYRDELPCISCVKNKCPLGGDEHMRCMKEITVDAVLSHIRELLAPAQ